MKCPNCDNKLTLMGAIEVICQKDCDKVEIQYNCEECTYDWKWIATFDSKTKLSPIFWG